MIDRSKSVGFEALRKHAKRWLAALRGGDAEALARLERVLPRHSAQPGLREVQQALAREHGFVAAPRHLTISGRCRRCAAG